MSFTAIDSANIAAGDPVTQTLWNLVKDDLDNHESRIGTLEAEITQLLPIAFDVLGYSHAAMVQDGILYFRVPFNMTLLAARLFIVTAGASGSTSVDIEYKRGVSAWSTILTGDITAAFGAGDLYVASGTLAVSSLLTGDLLRLNIDAVQAGAKDFSVYIECQGS